MGASFAGMALLYVLFCKFVPIISIWEMKAAPTQARAAEAAGAAQPADAHARLGPNAAEEST
jgi:hypothetical protein